MLPGQTSSRLTNRQGSHAIDLGQPTVRQIRRADIANICRGELGVDIQFPADPVRSIGCLRSLTPVRRVPTGAAFRSIVNEIHVAFDERMAMRAVCGPWLRLTNEAHYPRGPSSYVLRVRHGLQMARADTSSNAAEVVQYQTIRDRAVRESVSWMTVETAVIMRIESSSPNPTWPEIKTMLGHGAVLIDLRPESLLRSSANRPDLSRRKGSAVMPTTETASNDPAAASIARFQARPTTCEVRHPRISRSSPLGPSAQRDMTLRTSAQAHSLESLGRPLAAS